jgi:hypothetical protein
MVPYKERREPHLETEEKILRPLCPPPEIHKRNRVHYVMIVCPIQYNSLFKSETDSNEAFDRDRVKDLSALAPPGP